MLRRKQDSKLGAVAPRHAAWLCRAAHLGKGSASPSRCIPSEQGAFRGPRAPQRPKGLAPWNPCQAFAPDTTTKNPARFFDLCPTVRRLNARSGTFAFPTPNDQRRSALDRKSGEPCSSDTASVRLSRPTPRPNRAPVGCRQCRVPLHRQSGEPCSPMPPASSFRVRHHDERRSASRHLTKRAPLGLAPACAAGPDLAERCPDDGNARLRIIGGNTGGRAGDHLSARSAAAHEEGDERQRQPAPEERRAISHRRCRASGVGGSGSGERRQPWGLRDAAGGNRQQHGQPTALKPSPRSPSTPRR